MSEDKIQSTKEAMYKFSQVETLSDIEQNILRNGANAIEQLQKENKELKETLENNSKFEKWLKEKIDKAIGTEYSIFVDCLDKLQELKGSKNDN